MHNKKQYINLKIIFNSHLSLNNFIQTFTCNFSSSNVQPWQSLSKSLPFSIHWVIWNKVLFESVNNAVAGNFICPGIQSQGQLDSSKFIL